MDQDHLKKEPMDQDRLENYRLKWFPQNLETKMDQDLPSMSNLENYRLNWFPKNLETKKIFGEIEEIVDDVERRFNRFKNFNIIPFPPYDHEFLTCKGVDQMNIISECGFRRRIKQERELDEWELERRFRQRIKQEWELLSAIIPSSIFVRVYEHRIDLMRAAVIGPRESDYHHCLFFFDIFFPRNYPSVPPELHYRSYGIDLNPNLRPHRRVCLTLPEGWYNRLKQNLNGNNDKEEREPLLKKEKWDPKESNISHVLHEIQNRILNLKPHSVELSRICSYVKSGSLKKHNERAFVLAGEMMTRVLRNPPKGFEDFVAGHFRRRAHPVLLKFKENKYDSEGLINLFVILFNEFERNGTYCQHHLDFLRSIKISIEEVEARIRNLEGHHQWNEEDLLKI